MTEHGSQQQNTDSSAPHLLVGHDLCAVAFPRLSERQIAALARCTGARLERHAAGTVLVEGGEREPGFHVVVSGEIEVLDATADDPRTLTILGPGEFTGDVAHLMGAIAMARILARCDCEVQAVAASSLRGVLSQCADVGDLVLQAFIARRELLREASGYSGLRVIGSRYSRDSFRVRDFLSRNRVPFTFLDLETDPQVEQMLHQFGVPASDTPVVACGRKMLLHNPSNRELAEAIGLHRPLQQATWDLAIVGAGPAGLAAAVYAASEGLATVMLERLGPGGQAGRSARIENYPGFPIGISGGELADRAVLQAAKFGAILSVPAAVVGLELEKAYSVLRLDDGQTVAAKCLLIATGADYRRLTAEGCEQFEGCGVYYAATLNEAQACGGADVVVVGGGNSAGQAAVYLAQFARRVHLVVRGGDLYEDMSAYLARRIENTDNIEVLLHTVVRSMHGDGHLARVEVVDQRSGEPRTLAVAALFSFIGAAPRTAWLPDEIDKDADGFVLTGSAVAQSPRWSARRQPLLLETSREGTFAAGDVRADSVKRVASAVGEGAMAVQLVHECLKHR